MARNTAPKTDEAAIRQILLALRAAGYVLAYVNNGEEEIPVSSVAEAITAITEVDAASVVVRHPRKESSHVLFALGNSPEEVAADYGVSLMPVIDPLTASWW